MNFAVIVHTWYLSFFLHEQNFWRIKFTLKKTCKLRQNTQKIANFLRYYGKIHSKLPIFRVKSVKIYTGQKKFTWEFSWLSWQIWGMVLNRRSMTLFGHICHLLIFFFFYFVRGGRILIMWATFWIGDQWLCSFLSVSASLGAPSITLLEERKC